MENTDRDHGQNDEPTQGENPGAQGDFGAGQGDPGEAESIADAEDKPDDELPLDAAGEDEPIAPYDRDPGEDATMTNGGNATR